MTAPKKPLAPGDRVAAIRKRAEALYAAIVRDCKLGHLTMSIPPDAEYDTDMLAVSVSYEDIPWLLTQLDRAEAERDEAQAGARTIILEYDRLRASLAAAREALERIAKRPDLPNPERDADWKACMKLSAQEARAALTSIGAQAEKPGAQGAPELERREQ
jgi:hypothetical protein